MTELKPGARPADKPEQAGQVQGPADRGGQTAQAPADTSAQRAESKEPRSAAERVRGFSRDDLTGLADPYPPYEDKSVEDLRAECESRGWPGVPREVERAELSALIRAKDPHSQLSAALGHMTLEQVRDAAKEEGVELDEEFEKSHLITTLRASDTRTS